MKLVDSKLTMALQMMEKLLVPLGTPSSKHKANLLAPEEELGRVTSPQWMMSSLMNVRE